jgi:hypothetical protein
MAYSPFVVEEFGGLNLRGDPGEVGAQGAVDLLNVDLDRQGRVRSRDGYDNFTSAAAASRLDGIRAVQSSSLGGGLPTVRQMLVSSSAGAFYRAYTYTGATISDRTGITPYEADFTRFGDPTDQMVYASSTDTDPVTGTGTANTVYKWNGVVWAAATGVRLGGAGNYPLMLEGKPGDNRLVGAFATSSYSRVGFSGAGTPETWGANDYVDVTPGDGERITAMVAWRDMVFVFKETKFFVFGTTSTSGTGSAIFNYRTVATGVGAVGRACAVASPNGVYFLSRRGIYRTTGDAPQLVSRAIDPIFRGGASSFYTGGVLNTAYIARCQLMWHDERLFFAYPSGTATANDRLLVFDPETDQWLLWDVPANGLSSYFNGTEQQLAFTYATGSNHVGVLSGSFTTDDGTAIASRYQSGFYEAGKPGADTFTRSTRLWGTGTPTLGVLTNYATSDTDAAAVTLGTSPATAEGIRSRSYQGRVFSHKLSATSAWSVNRIIHDVSWTRP